MKKFFYLLFSILFASTASFAQKKIDLRATLLTPANFTTITAGQTFNAKVTVRNVGNFALAITDSIAVYMVVDNDTIPASPTSKYISYHHGNIFKPQDSVVISAMGQFPLGRPTDTVNFCMLAYAISGDVDSISDNNVADNRSCATVYVLGQSGPGTGVGSVTPEANGTILYPNPAHGTVTIGFGLGKATEVTYAISDIAGRTVVSGKQSYPQGDHKLPIDISNVLPGFYTYRLQAGAYIHTGRLIVQ